MSVSNVLTCTYNSTVNVKYVINVKYKFRKTSCLLVVTSFSLNLHRKLVKENLFVNCEIVPALLTKLGGGLFILLLLTATL